MPTAPKAKAQVKGTKAPKAKSVASVGAMKFSGKTYTKASCHNTKATAQKAAKELRASGNLARVVERCVFTRKK
jgi:hypothetical protein